MADNKRKAYYDPIKAGDRALIGHRGVESSSSIPRSSILGYSMKGDQVPCSSNDNQNNNRRFFFQHVVEHTTAALSVATTGAFGFQSKPALASEAVENVVTDAVMTVDPLIDVYFGCGCFWHVQHEFVEAERKILGRSSDMSLTARAGYAGGTKNNNKNDKVCYHNALNVADYGQLGHAEVVKLQIPTSSFPEFCQEYMKLFSEEGYRPDQFGDRGPEYRNLVGVPGGVKSEYAQALVKASVANGDRLDFAVGKGNDADKPKVVFVMDSTEFPFHVAEQYHQFHDGFNFGENYPAKYNNLANEFGKAEEDFGSCPNGMMGVGVGGL